jgi:uncharacterized membrane protein
MANTILGIFTERESVEKTINQLKSNGYNPKEISIVMKDKEEGDKKTDEKGSDVAESAVAGATSGAVLGGLAGLLASFVIPGIGAFFIGGPIAVALGLTGAVATTATGVATGALAGGIVGALIEYGLSEDEAKIYEERVKEGAILLAVEAREGEVDMVKTIFTDNNAEDVRSVSLTTN